MSSVQPQAQGQVNDAGQLTFKRSFNQRWGKFLAFQAPKLVLIEDVKVGLAHRCLQIIFLSVVLTEFVGNKKYLDKQDVRGFVGFWATPGDLAKLQAEEASMPERLCRNASLNYFSGSQIGKYAWSECRNLPYSELHEKGEEQFFVQTSKIDIITAAQDCSSAKDPNCRPNGHEIWDEVNRGTLSTRPADARDKGEQYGASSRNECECLRDRSAWRETFQNDVLSISLDHDRCRCLRRQHVYTPGVEEMVLVLEPTMTTEWPTGPLGVCSGISTVSMPSMTVKGRDTGLECDSCLECDKQGNKCTVPVRELLRLIGIKSLDDQWGTYITGPDGKPLDKSAQSAEQLRDYRSALIDVNGYGRSTYNSVCSSTLHAPPSFCFPSTTPPQPSVWEPDQTLPPNAPDPDAKLAHDAARLPTYRQTGLAIELDIRFTHDCDDGNVAAAELLVSNTHTVWNSKGSKIDYDTWQAGCSVNATGGTCTTSRDRYRFGLKSLFRVSGTSTRFDLGFVLTKVSEMFVTMIIATTLVSIVTFYMIPNKSRFYKTRRQEEVNIDIVNARLAAQTAINALSFKALDTDNDGVISREELTGIFLQSNPKLTQDQAQRMTQHILKVADEQATGHLNFQEFMKCIAEDPTSLELMYSTVARPKFSEMGSQGSTRLDPPYQMWEKRTTPEGFTYFANHDTKVTTWTDPRTAQQQASAQQQIMMQQQQMMVQQQQVVPQVQMAPQQMVVLQQAGPQRTV